MMSNSRLNKLELDTLKYTFQNLPVLFKPMYQTCKIFPFITTAVPSATATFQYLESTSKLKHL